jgi:hypothetical protein
MESQYLHEMRCCSVSRQTIFTAYVAYLLIKFGRIAVADVIMINRKLVLLNYDFSFRRVIAVIAVQECKNYIRFHFIMCFRCNNEHLVVKYCLKT